MHEGAGGADTGERGDGKGKGKRSVLKRNIINFNQAQINLTDAYFSLLKDNESLFGGATH